MEIREKRTKRKGDGDMQEYVELFIMSLEGANRSENTIRSYNTTLRDFGEFLIEKKISDLSQVKTIHLDLYQATLMKKNRSSSVRTKMNIIGKFFSYMQAMEYIDKNPKTAMTKVKVKDADVKIKENANLKEILHLIEETEKNSVPLLKERNKLIIVCLAFFGLRVSELANLKVKDISFQEKTVHIFGKGGSYRGLPIPPAISEDLRNYCKNKKADDYVFTVKRTKKPMDERSIRDLVYQHAKKAKLKKHIHPHGLRRSMATNMSEDGHDIKTIQEMLGHKSITTTSLYVNKDKERMKEEVRRNNSLAQAYKKQKRQMP